jgi:hypothetical protein
MFWLLACLSHRSYKALIGGYLHYALSDLTGYTPQQLIIQPGFVGYDPHISGSLWGEPWRLMEQERVTLCNLLT